MDHKALRDLGKQAAVDLKVLHGNGVFSQKASKLGIVFARGVDGSSSVREDMI